MENHPTLSFPCRLVTCVSHLIHDCHPDRDSRAMIFTDCVLLCEVGIAMLIELKDTKWAIILLFVRDVGYQYALAAVVNTALVPLRTSPLQRGLNLPASCNGLCTFRRATRST
jgi:hypothetical protein